MKSAAFWDVNVRAFAARSHPKMRGFTPEIPKETLKFFPFYRHIHVAGIKFAQICTIFFITHKSHFNETAIDG